MTPERLKQLVSYDEATGTLIRIRRSHRDFPTVRSWKLWHHRLYQPIGSANSSGYLVVKLDDKVYYVHRLVWLYHHGSWPKHEIDHIDRDVTNNAITNLRDVPHCENTANRRYHGRQAQL